MRLGKVPEKYVRRNKPGKDEQMPNGLPAGRVRRAVWA